MATSSLSSNTVGNLINSDFRMIELEIFPASLDSCVFEFDIEQNTVSFYRMWQGNENNIQERSMFIISGKASIQDLIELSMIVVSNRRIDNRFILDGVKLICTISENQVHDTYEFKNPESGSEEWLLVDKFLDLASSLPLDQESKNYLELVEGYFSDQLPVKHFKEKPYRLRIYGMLSIYAKKGLIDEIAKILSIEEVTVDMTNFIGMGTALYECFEPLKRKSGVKFIVNDNALQALMEMGFEMNIISKLI